MKITAACLIALVSVCLSGLGDAFAPTSSSTTTTIGTYHGVTLLEAAKSKEEDLELTRKVIASFFSDEMGSSSDEKPAAKTKKEEAGDAPAKKKKKNKKKKKQAEPAPAVEIDVSKLDIRVGEIQKAWEHPEADKLYCEEIDLGEDGGPRQIASGLRAHYSLEDLQGRKVLVLANLKARKLVGFPSHGMVLCAVNDEDKVVFVNPPEGAEIGERVMVEGYDGEPATENQVIKKKMLDAIFPDLATNGDGVATFRKTPMTTSAGACTSELKNAMIS